MGTSPCRRCAYAERPLREPRGAASGRPRPSRTGGLGYAGPLENRALRDGLRQITDIEERKMASTETRATSPQHVFEQISRHVECGRSRGSARAVRARGRVCAPARGGDRRTRSDPGRAGAHPGDDRMSGEVQRVVGTNEVALVFNRWRLEGTRLDGSPVEMSGLSADVVRRRPDRQLARPDRRSVGWRNVTF